MLLRPWWRHLAARCSWPRPRLAGAVLLLLLSCLALPAHAVVGATPTILPNPQVGVPYNQTLTGNGGTGPYSFQRVTPLFPAGLTLSPDGVFSGTPTQAGSFSFDVVITDSLGSMGTQTYTLFVALPTLSATINTPRGKVAVAYTGSIAASGGTGPYTYSLISGALPLGVSFGSNGSFSGTPRSDGSYPMVIRATDSSSGTGAPFFRDFNVELDVDPPTIVISPTAIGTMNVGQAFTVALSATGGVAPYTWSLSSGGLPPGVSLNSGGTVNGPGTVPGHYTFDVGVTDDAGYTTHQSYTIDIVAPPPLSISSNVADGIAGQNYSATFTTTGGNAPYSYSLVSGALPPGLGLSSTGTFTGTPTTPGTYHFVVRATDGSQSVPALTTTLAVDLTITAPAITLAPATLAAVKRAAPFNVTLTASGGSGAYTYSLVSGALPPGVGLSSAGVLSGTPTTSGTYTFTVSVHDAGGFPGQQTYSLVVSDAPVTVDDNATLTANTSQAIAVTANDTGDISSIAIAQAPAHGTVTINGLNAVYIPTANYVGADSFTYTATGVGGTSAPATVSITVTPQAAPVAVAQALTVLAGQSIVVHGAQGASGGPFTALAITTPPGEGTATVSGTDVTFTPPSHASGTYGFDFTLSNAFGTSAPAHVTLTVNPLPMTAPKTASVKAGQSVSVDLTSGAAGGPFTEATLVAVTPSGAGSASIAAGGSGYTLAFAASPGFNGTATVTYTLTNAYATSAPGVVTITVIGRGDPSKDAEVRGILDAQADAARRLAIGQISNFQRRLESLHRGADSGFTNGITLGSASSRQNRDPLQGLRNGDEFTRRYLVNDDEPGTSGARSAGPALPGGIAVWTGGAVNFGKSQVGASDNGIDFTTSGLSVGIDKPFSDNFAMGFGLGYGHDASDIGKHNSRSTVDSYNVAFYGSYRPTPATFVDSLLGYQWLSFDARRYVTDNGSTVRGSRDGKQWFGSFAVGYEHRTEGSLVSPYARLDLAHAQLDGYTERGDAYYALNYGRQTVKTSTGTLGVRAEWTAKRDYGVWIPRLRAEFGHDFQGSSAATMRYADLLTGPMYQATLSNQSRNHTLLGAGIELQTLRGFVLRAEYQNLLDNSSRDNQSVLLGVEKTFEP